MSDAFDAVVYSLEHREDRRFADALDMTSLAELADDERKRMRALLEQRLGDPRVPSALAQLSLDALLPALDRPEVAVSAAAALRETLKDRLRGVLIAGLDGPEAAAAAHELRFYDFGDDELASLIERRGDLAAVATQSLFYKRRFTAWKPPLHLGGMALLEALLSTEHDSLRLPAVSVLHQLLALRRPSDLGFLPVDPDRSETLTRFLDSMDAGGDYDTVALARLDGEERRWCEYMLSVQELLGNGDARAARALAEVKWPAVIDPLRAALTRTRGAAPVESARALLRLPSLPEDARTEAVAALRRASEEPEQRERALAVMRELGVS